MKSVRHKSEVTEVIGDNSKRTKSKSYMIVAVMLDRSTDLKVNSQMDWPSTKELVNSETSVSVSFCPYIIYCKSTMETFSFKTKFFWHLAHIGQLLNPNM